MIAACRECEHRPNEQRPNENIIAFSLFHNVHAVLLLLWHYARMLTLQR